MKNQESPFRPLMGRGDVERQRLSFRDQLWHLAFQERWGEWHKTRLIFADWLCDHNHLESHIARADWDCKLSRRSSSKERIIFQAWTVPFHGPDDFLIGKCNSVPVLGFDSQSLVFKKLDKSFLHLTWVPGRVVKSGTDMSRRNPYGITFAYAPLPERKRLMESYMKLYPSFYDGINNHQWWAEFEQ